MSEPKNRKEEKKNEVDGTALAVSAVVAGGLLAGGIWAMTKLFQSFNSEETDDSVFLYHYTDPDSSLGIQQSRMIRKTKIRRNDTYFGEGVYMTSLHPKNGEECILENNYNIGNPRNNKRNKAKIFFRFRKSQLRNVKKQNDAKRDVWLNYTDIQLGGIECMMGETEFPDRLTRA